MLLNRIKTSGNITFPKVYFACGIEDYLLRANRQLAAFLKANGADVTHEEGPGKHDWDFWTLTFSKCWIGCPSRKSPNHEEQEMRGSDEKRKGDFYERT
jgi:acetyl esterase/lipase